MESESGIGTDRVPRVLLSQKSSNNAFSLFGVAPSCQPKKSNSEEGIAVSFREKLLVRAMILCLSAAVNSRQ